MQLYLQQTSVLIKPREEHPYTSLFTSTVTQKDRKENPGKMMHTLLRHVTNICKGMGMLHANSLLSPLEI